MAVIFTKSGGMSVRDPFTPTSKKKKKSGTPPPAPAPPQSNKIIKDKAPPSTAEGTFVDVNTGKPSGITIDGKTYLGLGPQDVEAIQQRRAEDAAIGSTPIEESVREESLKESAMRPLEKAGAFEEITPTRTELSPENISGPLGKLPVIGPIMNAIANVLTPQEFEQGFGIPITPETVREQALRTLRDDSFKEGLSLAESFGSFIESIPIIGSLARKYAAGLIETPSSNADAVIANLESLGTEATNNQEKTRSGIMPSEYAIDRARKMEEQIAQLEGRLKVLINSSPILQANTDEVNRIEQKIFETKERVNNFRNAARFAYTASLTGTGRVVPTDEQLFFELMDKRK